MSSSMFELMNNDVQKMYVIGIFRMKMLIFGLFIFTGDYTELFLSIEFL